MSQSSIVKTKVHWWQTLIFCLVAYIILGSSFLAVCRLADIDLSAEFYAGWGCLISFAILFVVGVGLVCWREIAWGWAILVFTAIAFMLFFWVLLPWLAKAKAYA